MHVQGETPARGSRLWGVVLFGVFMSPLLAIGGASLQMAIERDGTPALALTVVGCCLLGLWGFLLWLMRARMRAEVVWFSLDDEHLRIQTVGRGELRVSVADVLKCQRNTGRQSGLLGWWVRFRQAGWVYLPKDNSSAARLAERLETLLRRS